MVVRVELEVFRQNERQQKICVYKIIMGGFIPLNVEREIKKNGISYLIKTRNYAKLFVIF